MKINELKDVYQKGTLLNIAASSQGTRALGPGLRGAVWLQGCPRHCFNCIAQDWLAIRPNKLISPLALADMLLEKPVEGLTISGGDPMLQAAGLVQMVEKIREKRDLDIICYTGYEYEELRSLQNQAINKLLSLIDVLIEGPYIDALNDDQGLRGSSNQKVIHLTDRLKGFDFHHQKRSLEINVQEGTLFSIGVPERKMKTALENFSKSIHEQKSSGETKKRQPRIRIRTEKKNERA